MIAMFLAAGALDQARETAETFGFDWKIFFSQVISFVIVALVLRRFAYKPILGILEERRQRIAEGLLNADKIKQQLAAAEQIMAKAREASAIEHERTMTELKRELGRLVVDTTAKVTGKVLTSEDQRRLQEEASRQIAS
jgi:F-type H+-transporting ATPase subunit b